MQDHQVNNKNIRVVTILSLIALLLQPAVNAQSDSELNDAARECQRVVDLSARLACYDRVLPPVVDSPVVDTTGPEAVPIATPATRAPMPTPAPTQQAERNTAARSPEPDTSQSVVARIVEVQTPSISTTLFHAADGRVFRRERASRIYRWPEPPFDVEIQTSRFGAVYLRFADGLRVRVANRF